MIEERADRRLVMQFGHYVGAEEQDRPSADRARPTILLADRVDQIHRHSEAIVEERRLEMRLPARKGIAEGGSGLRDLGALPGPALQKAKRGDVEARLALALAVEIARQQRVEMGMKCRHALDITQRGGLVGEFGKIRREIGQRPGFRGRCRFRDR